MNPADEPISEGHSIGGWRLTGIGLLRITFGLVWAIDAWFKWQPDFINNFTDYLTGSGVEWSPQDATQMPRDRRHGMAARELPIASPSRFSVDLHSRVADDR